MKTVNKRPTHKELHKLWAECVKARAGYKSEYSGKTERLNAHHIIGKPNYRLRYELDNGYCCTGGEHLYIAHIQGRADEFRRNALAARGVTQEYLESLGKQIGGTDLFAVKIYLTQKLEEFKNGNS